MTGRSEPLFHWFVPIDDHGARRRLEDDRLGGHLWNRISRVRVNLGTAIVGTPGQVAAELAVS